MNYSANAIRHLSVFALTLIGFLQVPEGPRRPVLAARARTISRLNHERLLSPRLPQDTERKTKASEAYGRLPIRFEANDGQSNAKVKFLSRGSGYNFFLTQTEAVLTLPREKSSGAHGASSTVRMKIVGADPQARMEGIDMLPGRSNYIIGKDASRWRRNVVSFAKVRYRGVYPGIDLIYYGNQRQFEYDFVLSPGADPNVIKLGFDGANQIEIDASGELVLKTAGGEIQQRNPVAYQEVDGSRREVSSRYTLKGEKEIGFELGEYDRSRPLVIDPVIVYSTYLGGSNDELTDDIAVDAAGNAYVIGLTWSLNFPTSNPLQPAPGGNNDIGDVFVAKLNPEGSLVYSTYLGGDNYDDGYAIAVDGDGNAYLTGRTQSTDFPTKNALQPELATGSPFGIDEDFFVTKLNAEGSALIYSTYLGGGTAQDLGMDLAIDNERNVYVAGVTAANDFPTMNPLQANRAGGIDVVAAKLNADGSALVYSTYLGGGDVFFGGDNEDLSGIAVDGSGCLYLTGWTESDDFPTANPLQPALGGDELDAFVTKINPDGSAFVYSTYLGGADQDRGNAITADAHGAAYVTGISFSTDFPTVNPLQAVLSGPSDVFITKINPIGSAILYSTYLGGTGSDEGEGIAIDSRNNIYVSGFTISEDFPTLDAAQPRPDSGPGFTDNGFVARLKADGSRLMYSTYIGGRDYDDATCIAVDARGAAYVSGFTASDDFPTTPGAAQPENGGPARNPVFDAFISKFSAPRRHHHGHDKDCEDDHEGEERHSRKARH